MSIDFRFLGDTEDQDLSDQLGIPSSDVDPFDVTFYMSSQILVHPDSALYRYYKPHRFDCGCIEIECEEVGGSSGVTGTGPDNQGVLSENDEVLIVSPDDELIDMGGVEVGTDEETVDLSQAPTSFKLDCSIYDHFLDFNDFNIDEIESLRRLACNELVGVCDERLDKEDSSLFWVYQILTESGAIVDEQGEIFEEFFPDSGSFKFRDNYRIIYEIEWERNELTINSKTVIKDPRPTIEEPTLRVEGNERFTNGIITTIEREFENDGSGNYILETETIEQTTGEFQIYFPCGHDFIDPFVLHLECQVHDELEMEITQPEVLGIDDDDEIVASPDDEIIELGEDTFIIS